MREAVEIVNRIFFHRNLRFDVFHWTDLSPDFGSPQDQIDQRSPMLDVDLMVALFKQRLGTPAHDSPSGTAHELKLAITQRVQRGGRLPTIAVFFLAPGSNLLARR